MKKILIIMAVIAGVVKVKAQIGWTLDQCKAKYGNAESVYNDHFPGGENYRFHPDGFWVTVNINNGAVSGIIYEPTSSITEEQAEQILSKNSSSKWGAWTGSI